MAKTTSDSILGVIRKESWILDHFEIFVNIKSMCLAEVCTLRLLLLVTFCFRWLTLPKNLLFFFFFFSF